SDIHETQRITNVRESQYHKDMDVLEDKFDQLETYNESDNENTKKSGPLYSVAQRMDFKNWKELDDYIIEGYNKGHHTGNCKFHVNTYCQKTDNLVYIMKVYGQHNHELVENIGH
ncbi:1596_t:CDS:2, partial [Gigaspora margarita]